MRLDVPLLALLLSAPLHAQVSTMARDIRAGRSALQAGRPAQARSSFAAALAHPDGRRDDAFAAAVGLGQSTLWLGDYPAAAAAFRKARQQADDTAAQQRADTGLAQALNALDYPRQAEALVTPFARGKSRPTLELLRALQSLGRQDKSPAYLQAAPPPADGYLGRQYALLQDDMRLALADQIDGELAVSHDSENLDTYRLGASFRSAPQNHTWGVSRWGAAADTTHVAQGRLGRQLSDARALGQWRIADLHQVDLDLGLGRVGGWSFVQGALRWSVQPGDSFSVSAAAERAPVLTDGAIDQRLIYNTWSLATSVRPSAHWYLQPGYYRQDFSDGNHRDGGTLRLLLSPYDLAGTPAALGGELSTSSYRSTQPSRGVYFNPARYRASEFGLIGIYRLNPRWKLRVTADAGRQYINAVGADIYALALSLHGRLPHNGRLDLQLGRSSAASVGNGGAGYWNNTLSLSVTYPL
jgi:hypothetical protein